MKDIITNYRLDYINLKRRSIKRDEVNFKVLKKL